MRFMTPLLRRVHLIFVIVQPIQVKFIPINFESGIEAVSVKQQIKSRFYCWNGLKQVIYLDLKIQILMDLNKHFTSFLLNSVL